MANLLKWQNHDPYGFKHIILSLEISSTTPHPLRLINVYLYGLINGSGTLSAAITWALWFQMVLFRKQLVLSKDNFGRCKLFNNSNSLTYIGGPPVECSSTALWPHPDRSSSSLVPRERLWHHHHRFLSGTVMSLVAWKLVHPITITYVPFNSTHTLPSSHTHPSSHTPWHTPLLSHTHTRTLPTPPTHTHSPHTHIHTHRLVWTVLFVILV